MDEIEKKLNEEIIKMTNNLTIFIIKNTMINLADIIKKCNNYNEFKDFIIVFGEKCKEELENEKNN